MESLYSFARIGTKIDLTRDLLTAENGISIAKKRRTIPVRNITDFEVPGVFPSLTVKTSDGRKETFTLPNFEERDRFYASLQGAVSAVA